MYLIPVTVEGVLTFYQPTAIVLVIWHDCEKGKDPEVGRPGKSGFLRTSELPWSIEIRKIRNKYNRGAVNSEFSL